VSLAAVTGRQQWQQSAHHRRLLLLLLLLAVVARLSGHWLLLLGWETG
jgi:hypothetical protein